MNKRQNSVENKERKLHSVREERLIAKKIVNVTNQEKKKTIENLSRHGLKVLYSKRNEKQKKLRREGGFRKTKRVYKKRISGHLACCLCLRKVSG